METEEQRQEQLTRPSRLDVEFAARLKGDVILLGAGGKMGPTLAKRLRRAISEASSASRVVAVSRSQGEETITCDLMDPASVERLPRFENVLYMAGRKFGSAGNPEETWAANTVIPVNVARHFRDSRIVVFSTGNVYPFVSPMEGGSRESDDPVPLGEYAQSCLGRERIFEYYSRQFGTQCLIYRLNYAIDLTYGVLVDIARQVFDGKPVDLSVPAVNVIWQGDANSYAMRSLELCESPARRLNVTGPETIPVRRAAEFFARRFGRSLDFTGTPGGTALLSDAGVCHAALGYPEVTAAQLMEWVAVWIERGGALQEKPTKFQVTDGKF
jgi:nucleoside-diphosphate-sugar epimerase